MPLEDVIAAQNGADPGVAQADQERIARQLFGDELVNQFGDVIGARKPGIRDALRDFTLGAAKGPEAVGALHEQIRNQAETTMVRQRRAAIAQAQEDRQKATFALSAIEAANRLPTKHRKGVLKDLLGQVGIEPPKAVLDMFTDAELIGSLPTKKIIDAINSGESSLSFDDVAGVLGSTDRAAGFVQTAIRAKANENDLNKQIVDLERKKLSLADAVRRFKEAQETKRERRSGIRSGAKLKKLGVEQKRRALDEGGNPLDAAIADLLKGSTPTTPAPSQTATTTTATPNLTDVSKPGAPVKQLAEGQTTQGNAFKLVQ